MSDLIPKTLAEVFETLAQLHDAEPCCPVAASLAYDHMESAAGLKRFVLAQIAANQAEPWAAQVASDWLRDNQTDL